MRVQLEFLLLQKILRAFRHQQRADGWTVVSKTSITRRFLFRRLRDSLTAQEFYNRVMPDWLQRGLAQEEFRPRKPPIYLLRPMSAEEIETRISQIEREAQRMTKLLKAESPECRQGDLSRLGDEHHALLLERRAHLDQRLTTACHRTLMAQELAKSRNS